MMSKLPGECNGSRMKIDHRILKNSQSAIANEKKNSVNVTVPELEDISVPRPGQIHKPFIRNSSLRLKHFNNIYISFAVWFPVLNGECGGISYSVFIHFCVPKFKSP